MAERSRFATLAEQLDVHVGPELRTEIMQGSDAAEAPAGPAKQAKWMKSAMDRLDALVDEPMRIKVMEECGRHCAWKGRAEKIRTFRAKSKTMDEFCAKLKAFLEPGNGIDWNGLTIYASYPKCYCGRVSATKEPISITHCHCGKGYWMAMFEYALGKPIRVDLLETVISGGDKCRFAIHVPTDEF